MTFTDEDIRNLKVLTRSVDGLPVGATVNAKDILALIARLEAAEALHSAMWAYHKGQGKAEDFDKAIDAWRKAAGK
jgi:hypothetical protein